MNDRQITLREVADAVDISIDSCHEVFILSDFGCIPDNLDHCAVEHILPKDMWEGRSRWRRGAISFLTDGSKLKGKVGGRVFLFQTATPL